jgi:thiol-disulfide isomerase/thioredoxin
MIYIVILALSFFKLPGWKAEGSTSIDTPKDSLTIQIMDYDELKPLLELNNDTTYVFNFWATWCLPCVKELPYFIQLDSVYREEPFRLVLVSLDFKKDYLRKLQPFVRERGIQEHVIVLEDHRSDYWINDIDRSWGGSIPATLVYKGKKRAFFERTFHHVNELSDIVKPFLNH